MKKPLTPIQKRLLRVLAVDTAYVARQQDERPLEALEARGYARVGLIGGWFLTDAGLKERERQLAALLAYNEAQQRGGLIRQARPPVLTITVSALDPATQKAMARHLTEHLRTVMHFETPWEVVEASSSGPSVDQERAGPPARRA